MTARRTNKPVARPAECAVLTIETEARSAEAIAERVRNSWGVPVVEMEYPGRSARWLEAYFATDVEAILAGRALYGRRGIRGFSVRALGSRDWSAYWKEHFRRFDVGSRLTVCPPWDCRRRPRTNRRNVVVNPGIGFGTGDHFTTRFCLETIDSLCARRPPRSMLDVGTGSGILAIAGARLGVPRVHAVDVDAQSLDEARANARRNRVSGLIDFRRMDITRQHPSGRFELVCANLVTTLLLECAEDLVACARRHLVVSGIRENETDLVADTFARLGGREIVRDGNGEWSGLALEW